MALDPVIALIKDDPDLMHRLVDAGSPEERAAILAEYGVEVPDPEHVKAKMTELLAVSGGGAIGAGFAIAGADVVAVAAVAAAAA